MASVSEEPDLLACLTANADGCALRVQIVPNAASTGCAGFHDDALRVRVQSPPIDGRANQALLRWLTEGLGLPGRAASLLSGHSARSKRVQLDCPRAQVAIWLLTQLPPDKGKQ